MIHKYFLNGFHIVLDVCSGAVHVVDEMIYNMLDYISPPMERECPESLTGALSGEFSKEDILAAYDELYALYEDGSLFSEDTYVRYADKLSASPVKALCLHIAHDCNLRCKYCFASTGNFGGQKREVMSYETGKRAIDFLIEESKGRHNLEIDFFGGEPLMNFEVIKQLVGYARSKEEEYDKCFRFTVTTNGLLLDDDKIGFINKEMSNVVLSLDGRPEVNDKMRPGQNGRGSYRVIVPKFQKLVKGRGDKDYYVRGTFTKYNLDFSEDVFHIYSLGFDQLSVEPVVSGGEEPYTISDRDLPQIYDEYEKLAKRLILEKKKGSGINFFHYMLDLTQGPCAIKRLRGCGCGNEYVAITPGGDIYPCHQFVGQDEWKMGNLYDGTFDREKKAYFAETTVYHKEDCKECFARFYCSGGCNANNYTYCKDVKKPLKIACDMQKKRLECAIMIQAAMATEE